MVLTFRGRIALMRPLAELLAHVASALADRRPWTDPFRLSSPDDGYSASIVQHAAGYLRILGDEYGTYDLDRLADGRPCCARAGGPLFALAAHGRMIWLPEAELPTAMALP